MCKFVKNNWYLIFTLIPLVGIWLFYREFGALDLSKGNFSSKIAEWGAFGDYFNWIIGFVNLILLVKLTQIANNLSNKSLEKELTFEIYKNFLAKIDQYIDEYKQALKNGNVLECKLSLASIGDLTNSAKEDFSSLFNDTELQKFKYLCDTIATETAKGDKADTTIITTSISAIRTFLYKQIRN